MKSILSTIIPFLSLINGQSTNNGRSGEVRPIINVVASIPSPSTCVADYQQCGGKTNGNSPYTGLTNCCTDGYVCTVVSEFYSQCDPNTPDFQNNDPNPPSPPSKPANGVSPDATDPITGCKLAYAQCGGLDYVGPTKCCDDTICTELSPYWSQCQPKNEPIGAPGIAPANPPQSQPQGPALINRGSADNKCLLQGQLCGLPGGESCCSGLQCVLIESGNGLNAVIAYQCLSIN